MKPGFAVTIALLVFAAKPVYAQIPDNVLDADYQKCAGDGQDADRNAFCDCVRSGMKGWDEADYMTIAGQASKNSADPQLSPKLTDLAQQCLAKTLH